MLARTWCNLLPVLVLWILSQVVIGGSNVDFTVQVLQHEVKVRKCYEFYKNAN